MFCRESFEKGRSLHKELVGCYAPEESVIGSSRYVEDGGSIGVASHGQADLLPSASGQVVGSFDLDLFPSSGMDLDL